MISFRLTKHTIREVDIVEVYDGDRFVASIYPAETSMRIVSDHLASVNVDETVVPAFTFEFKDAPTQ